MYHNFSNLASIAIQFVTLVVLIIATAYGFKQLNQIKNTRISEFLRDFKLFMLDEKHSKVRRMIYHDVPHPFKESKAHEQWLSKLRTRRPEIYHKIENEIYTIDWLAYMVRRSKVGVDLILEQWFDVVARVVIGDYLAKKTQERSSA